MIAYVGMNNKRLGRVLRRVAEVVEGEPGYWQIEYHGRRLWIITDEGHDRMRIMTPIVNADELSEDDYKVLLAANFDRALDAKYAIAQDAVWSLFMHPLADLTENFLLDALQQVKTLADNYGTSYSSSGLIFGGGQ